MSPPHTALGAGGAFSAHPLGGAPPNLCPGAEGVRGHHSVLAWLNLGAPWEHGDECSTPNPVTQCCSTPNPVTRCCSTPNPVIQCFSPKSCNSVFFPQILYLSVFPPNLTTPRARLGQPCLPRDGQGQKDPGCPHFVRKVLFLCIYRLHKKKKK